VEYSGETHKPKSKKTIILHRISHNINSSILPTWLMRGLPPCGTTLCDPDANLDYDTETKFRQSGRTIRSPQLPSREEIDLTVRRRQAENTRRGEWRGKRSRDRPCTKSLTRKDGTWLCEMQNRQRGGPKILHCEPSAQFKVARHLSASTLELISTLGDINSEVRL
jgi:hypothetical protein